MNPAKVADNKQRSNILIIDDDELIRDTLKLVLETNGFTTFTAANGKKALEFLSTKVPRPDLILLDLMMPVMDGWEFVDVVEKDPRFAAIPIVIITAFNEKAKPIKVKKIIKKPISLDYLLTTVNEQCAAHRSGHGNG